MKKINIGIDPNIRNLLWSIIYSIIKIFYCLLYIVCVMCACYNLILYYRLTVSNIIYFIKKILKCFYTTHIHYRIVNIDKYFWLSLFFNFIMKTLSFIHESLYIVLFVNWLSPQTTASLNYLSWTIITLCF